MDCMGSDHLPILITLDIPITTLKPTTSRSLRWNWSKADFEGFSNQVEMAVLVQKDSIGRASLDARMASLVVSITEAANSFIGKVKSSTNGKAWMTRDLREAVKFRNSLRRTTAGSGYLDIPKADRLKKSVRRQLKVPSVDGESSSPVWRNGVEEQALNNYVREGRSAETSEFCHRYYSCSL